MLKARLARARTLLALQLVSDYERDKPDLIGVVLDARGFNDLLEQIDFLKRAQGQTQSIIKITRTDKAAADNAQHRLSGLEATKVQVTNAAATRVRALAGMNALLQSKQTRWRGRVAPSRSRSTPAGRRAPTLRPRSPVHRPPKPRPPVRRPPSRQAPSAELELRPRARDGRPAVRPQRRLGDSLLDRAVRDRGDQRPAQLRHRFGLLRNRVGGVEAVRRLRACRLPGAQVRAGRGRPPDLGLVGPKAWVCAGIVGIH